MIIIGAGKHAKVVAEAAKAARISVRGVVAPEQQSLGEIPNVGDDDTLPALAGETFLVAVGDNQRRHSLYEKARAAGLEPISVIHPTAIISPTARIGKGVVIMARVVVQAGAEIKDNVILNTACTVDHDCVIEQSAHIGPGVNISGSVKVGEGAFIGAGSAVRDGVNVGEWATIGVGTPVYHDINHHSVVFGAPLRTSASKKQKRRVLIYAPIVGRGGVHRLVDRLTEAWCEYAPPDEWSFTAFGQGYDEIGEPMRWRVPFEQLPPYAAPYHPELFSFLTAHQQTFWTYLQQRQADFDLVWLPMPWWTMRVPQPHLSIPIVPTIPDFAFDQHGSTSWLASGFRQETHAFAQYAAMVCFPSEYQRMHGETRYQMQKTRTIYYADFLPRPFEPSETEAERVRLKYKLPPYYLLAFHCAHHKDPITILRGYALAKQGAVRFPLVLAGIETDGFIPGKRPPNEHAAEVQQVIEECGYKFGEDLFILGQIPDYDIAGLYAGSCLAITASRSEGGLSATIFEAFNAGTPMIFSDLPVFIERLGDQNEYGLHFKVGDPTDLARAIKQRWDDGLAKQRAQAAREFIRRRTWQDVANEYLELFREVIGR
jgi:UDP-perosamine 4-acetyltransferase